MCVHLLDEINSSEASDNRKQNAYESLDEAKMNDMHGNTKQGVCCSRNPYLSIQARFLKENKIQFLLTSVLQSSNLHSTVSPDLCIMTSCIRRRRFPCASNCGSRLVLTNIFYWKFEQRRVVAKCVGRLPRSWLLRTIYRYSSMGANLFRKNHTS